MRTAWRRDAVLLAERVRRVRRDFAVNEWWKRCSRGVAWSAFLLLGLLAWPVASHAQSVAIKLATVLPDGSIWDKNLKQMAAEWKQTTGDRVSVTLFGGGSQGDEPTVLRKIRLDALQAASLTVVGLASIDPAFNVFNVPFFFESYDELNAVIDKLTPMLKQRLEAKGFVLLHWGHGGWLQLFSKRPVKTVADLKAVKLWTSAGDDRMTQWYKANGFQPRAMAMTDILTGPHDRDDRRLAGAAARRAGVPVEPPGAAHARHRARASRRRHGDRDANLEPHRAGRSRRHVRDRRLPQRSGCGPKCPSRTGSPSR